MKRTLLVAAVALPVLAPLYSQVPTGPVCTVSATPRDINSNGESELTSDLVMACVNAAPSASTFVNISLFLNVPLTSRITNTTRVRRYWDTPACAAFQYSVLGIRHHCSE